MMRGIYAYLAALLLSSGIMAQKPVSWDFSVKKIDSKTYEIHLKANLSGSWHIYSQRTPEGGPIPTRIELNKNPLVIIKGLAKEKGKQIKKHEEVFDLDVLYYDEDVDFVQTVVLKTKAKTTLNGTVEYMLCTNDQCLPPAKTHFSVKLD